MCVCVWISAGERETGDLIQGLLCIAAHAFTCDDASYRPWGSPSPLCYRVQEGKTRQLRTNLGFYGSHPSGKLLSVSRCDLEISTAGLKSYCCGFSNHFRVYNHDICIFFSEGGWSPTHGKMSLILILYTISFYSQRHTCHLEHNLENFGGTEKRWNSVWFVYQHQISVKHLFTIGWSEKHGREAGTSHLFGFCIPARKEKKTEVGVAPQQSCCTEQQSLFTTTVVFRHVLPTLCFTPLH